jgi:hypothetical protein
MDAKETAQAGFARQPVICESVAFELLNDQAITLLQSMGISHLWFLTLHMVFCEIFTVPNQNLSAAKTLRGDVGTTKYAICPPFVKNMVHFTNAETRFCTQRHLDDLV